MNRTTKDIIDILTEAALISEQQAQEAVAMQKKQPLAKTLVELGYVTEEQVAKIIAEKLAYPFIKIYEYPVNKAVVSLISDEIARKYLAMPIDEEDGRLILAMADPANIYAIDDIQVITGRTVAPVVATESDIRENISRYCVSSETFANAAEKALDISQEEPNFDQESIENDAPIIRLVNMILVQGVNEHASDIHLEPAEECLRIRYRIDGVLHESMNIPKRIQLGLISRLKIMADMNIAEKRAPQDGRCGVIVEDHVIDMRLATLPTVYGEKMVIRILEQDKVLLKLEDLGFSEITLRTYVECFAKPYGAILVTGPTGSGKSTTLYATLNVLNSPEKNIITVEDPVEYRLNGVNQMQINPTAGVTFATGLRSILRSDPDIIMIGEIRDRETGMIAIESALTGHLVLSTLHTNDAAGALTRLVEMGIEGFLVGSAVDCIIAQRLVRKLCEYCKRPYEPPVEALEKLGVTFDPQDTYFKPVGCQHCNHSGYTGRIGVYEVLRVTDEIEKLTVSNASADEISRQAIAQGMRAMRHDGFLKFKKGITSIEEILRVIA